MAGPAADPASQGAAASCFAARSTSATSALSAAVYGNAALLRQVYDRLLVLAGRPNAERWLALVAFIDGAIFTLPPELLQLPMSLARPRRALHYALIGTVASTLGGLVAYLIGATLFEPVAMPILQFLGKQAEFAHFSADVRANALLWPVFYLLAPMPAGVAAGSLKLGLAGAIGAAVIGRGSRYLLVALVLQRFGATAARYIEAHSHTVLIVLAALFGAAVLVRYAL